jgi:hypothetical protein
MFGGGRAIGRDGLKRTDSLGQTRLTYSPTRRGEERRAKHEAAELTDLPRAVRKLYMLQGWHEPACLPTLRLYHVQCVVRTSHNIPREHRYGDSTATETAALRRYTVRVRRPPHGPHAWLHLSGSSRAEMRCETS